MVNEMIISQIVNIIFEGATLTFGTTKMILACYCIMLGTLGLVLSFLLFFALIKKVELVDVI